MDSDYTLVITEKPSVAKNYAKVLGADESYLGYWEGNGYLISWCYGHLVELAMPETYDDKYKHWKVDDLPIIPKVWNYQIKSSEDKHIEKQFDTLKELMHRDDVKEILCATDAGREGELIFRLVYQAANCKKPFQRIWISSMEESTIETAFASPIPGTYYDKVYEAALCRIKADWIVGMNCTRLFSCLYGEKGKVLNVGRVMTPTLEMIANREDEIARFVPKSVYTVNLTVNGTIFHSRPFQTEKEALQIKEKISVNENSSDSMKVQAILKKIIMSRTKNQ